MVDYKEGDFVKVDFNIYANGKLVQTTDEKKAKEANLDIKEFGPETIILGKAFILKALDDDILKNKKDSNVLELSAEKAYGKRDKNLIKTFKKSVFDEQKLRAVVGVTYDFNGMFGTVKSVVGGRVMVDFNNPLAGKEIKLEYSGVKKVDNIVEKLELVLDKILRLPKNMYKISLKDKKLSILIPGQLLMMKDALIKSFEELVAEIKDYEVKFDELKDKK